MIDTRTEAERLVKGDHDDPFAFLGPHVNPNGTTIVRAFLPGADRACVLDSLSRETMGELQRIGGGEVFAGRIDMPIGSPYLLQIAYGGREIVAEDPYRFPSTVSSTDRYFLTRGELDESYRTLGAHLMAVEGVSGVRFAVWAPNASRVSVVGDFNAWDGRRHTMRRHADCGLWEIFIPGIGADEKYKYEIKDRQSRLLPLKTDPYAFRCERPPATASIVAEIDLAPAPPAVVESRRARNGLDRPIAIYEVHLGSWRRRDGRYLTYGELADELVPYVSRLGFTHIELLPITEHPFDGSWGYQTTGMFAPTSRFGAPADFKAFVARCAQENIGVILDWVPGHFPADAHGLRSFDGTHLYEHADPRQGMHREWGTLVYNFGRAEVGNFLASSALFWIDCYGVDGLRVDAVASMLYLDYSRAPNEWVPNVHGGHENLEAIAFLHRVNKLAHAGPRGGTIYAEESTAWPMVSRPTYLGGLGFTYKWNMGWMHDTLDYMSLDPIFRRHHHDKMTFGLVYAFTENFVLPLSHDEVVHGKKSLLGRMKGDKWQRFANLRAYFGFMYGHPGKKLLFMGGEFAQEREWNHDAALDWHLLDDPLHAGMQRLVRDLNFLYRETAALHQRDCDANGFEWIDCTNVDQSIYAFLRRGRDDDGLAVVVSNFTPVPRQGYRIGVPRGGSWRERLNTDAEIYGGSNMGNLGGVAAENVAAHGREHSILLTLPPLATVVLLPDSAA